MKKIFILFFMLISALSIFAQASYGTYTFLGGDFKGAYYKPKLAFGKVNDQYLLVLLYMDNRRYASFNDESVMLLKFDDDTTVKLPISKVDEVTKDYSTEWGVNKYWDYYKTYASFDIEEETVDRIVKKHQKIKKIRVSFTNGDIQDCEIKEKNQDKLINGLIKSYNEVEEDDTKRKTNLNDVEADF